MRLIRLVRLVKLYRHYESNKAKVEKDVIGESSQDNLKHDNNVSDEDEEDVAESRVGQKLSGTK